MAINKILIANRGEIAVRVMRTARDLGHRTVAVYSDADAGALHVDEADEAVRIGSASVAESYLHVDRILAAAASVRADAIHPGYGFLAENAAFARACNEAGVTFIGPDATAIELMGSKRLSKAAMLDAGVPCIPGYNGANQDDAALIREAQCIGYPLMVKASAGGGGRGLRRVVSAADLPGEIARARSEAQNAFGDDELILEKAIDQPRHIEIQIFADRHDNVVYLGERDCSVQRRHQKVVEEAPSPFVDDALRRALGEAAVNAARACAYVGAGTVEFLVDAKRQFYFLEMNTRLQVEHPVTEMVTGQDLVAWQLIVADGGRLPLTQDEITIIGHAIEVRLYAEDPRNDFLPQTGTVRHWAYPRRAGVRVDHGIRTGQEIGAHYDPLLAKIVAWGDDRDTAARRLASAVEDTELIGVNHNKLFLHNVVRHDVFLSGAVTTSFIDTHFRHDPSLDRGGPAAATLARAALLYYLRGEAESLKRTPNRWRSAWGHSSFFRERSGDSVAEIWLREEDGVYRASVGDEDCEWRVVANNGQRCVVQDPMGVRTAMIYVFDNTTVYLDDGHGHCEIADVTHQPASSADAAGSGQITASMDGAVVKVLVEIGEAVAEGQTIVVVEAMKMEHRLKTGVAGVVASVDTRVGEQVKAKQLLVSVRALIEDAAESA